MKKSIFLSAMLFGVFQAHAMELVRRRSQEAPRPIDMQHYVRQDYDENIVTTDDLWDSCKRRMQLGGAGVAVVAAVGWLGTLYIPMAMGMGDCGSSCSTATYVQAGGIYFGPPICCCALSACLCKRALKGINKKKLLLLFAAR